MKQGILRKNQGIIDFIKRFIDIIIVLISGFTAHFYIFKTVAINSQYTMFFFIEILLTIIVFNSFSLYKAWRGIKILTELKIILYAWSLSCIISLIFSILFLQLPIIDTFKEWVIFWFFLSLFFLILFRICLKFILNYFRRIGFNQRHICLISCGNYGEEIYVNILNNLSYGFIIKSVFSDIEEFKNEKLNGVLKGKIENAFEWLENNVIDQIWVAAPFEKIEEVKKIMVKMQFKTVDIKFFPDLNSYNLINHYISELGNIPCFNLSVSPMETSINRLIKKLEDLILGFLVLIIFSPFMILIAILIKITSEGPVLYKQKRIGYNSRTFLINKFRTMPIDIERDSGAVWSKPNEQRATPFGRFLRKTSLDELPQLFNVLKGEMSLVGPRPERPEFVDKFKKDIPQYMKKHMVKAGMTGWAQVNGYRGNTSLKKRIEYDIYYIENWSFLFDIKIIFLTVFKGFINKNAH